MGFFSDIYNKITGRNVTAEEDLFSDPQKVTDLVTDIRNVATVTVPAAKTEVQKACNALKNATGFNYVEDKIGGTISFEEYNTDFDAIAEVIEELASDIEAKGELIQAYSQGSFWTRLATDITALVAESEGFFSVLENIGDRALSLVGYFMSDSAQEVIRTVVAEDHTSNLASLWYNSSFAKKYSALQEDSAITAALRVDGEAIGLLAIPGALHSAGAGKATEAAMQNDQYSYEEAIDKGNIGATVQDGTFVASLINGNALGDSFLWAAATGDRYADSLRPTTPPSSTTPRLVGSAPTTQPGTTSAPTPGTTGAPSPGTTSAPTPGTTSAPTPGTTSSPSSRRTSAPTPGTTSSPSPGTTSAPTPGTTSAPTPGTTSAPTPGTTGAPSPGTTGAPSPGTTGAPSPGTTGAPSPGTTGAPSPGTTGAPSPGTTGAPSPGTTGAPSPGTTGAPSPGAKPIDYTPSPGGGGGGYTPSPGNGGSSHSGGEYDGTNLNVDNELDSASNLELLEDEDSTASIDDIIKGPGIQRVTTTPEPIQTTKKSGSSSVIPIAAGLTAAAAAGIGAKAYMDYKKNNATGEDEEYDDEYNESYDDDFQTEEWQGDDSIAIDESSNDEDLIEYSNDNYYQEEDSGYTARDNAEDF